MADITPFGLKDTGTRWQHYVELLELWEQALAILEGYHYKTDDDTDRIVRLREGISLLRKQIDVMSGYHAGQYADAVYPLKLQIDRIPKDPAMIEGGRGTERKSQGDTNA